MKIGVVDVGGGLRGVYAAGIFDFCLAQNLRFDVCIGVSAGAANICSYLAGQKKRNYQFYTEYALRREYMSLRNIVSKHSYLDLNYVYGTLSNSGGANPVDFPALHRNPAEFVIVATNARTGEAKYFDKSDLHIDDYGILAASSAIPFVCPPYPVGGERFCDGARGDPVPVEKAFQMGCDKVVLILSRPLDVPRQPGRDPFFADRIRRKYPLAAQKLRHRAARYNEEVAAARQYAAQGRVLILAPDDTRGVDTLSRNRASMKMLYAAGCRDAAALPAFMQAECGHEGRSLFI
jgi:predicted patatin/cPLA2 family phospholipase